MSVDKMRYPVMAWEFFGASELVLVLELFEVYTPILVHSQHNRLLVVVAEIPTIEIFILSSIGELGQVSDGPIDDWRSFDHTIYQWRSSLKLAASYVDPASWCPCLVGNQDLRAILYPLENPVFVFHEKVLSCINANHFMRHMYLRSSSH